MPDSLQEAHDELAAQVAVLTERVTALENGRATAPTATPVGTPPIVSVPPTE